MATTNGNSNYPRWEDHSIGYDGKLFTTEHVIKINYTILYKLLYHLIFRSCHRNCAKRAYETVHHRIHAILQDSLRSSVWRLRLSFSVLYADCWRWRRHIGPVQYVGGREADEHSCAHCSPQPVVSMTITNTSRHTYCKLSDEKQFESVSTSVIAGWRQGPLTICDVSQRNYFTPTEHHIGSAVYTRDDRDTCAPSIVL